MANPPRNRHPQRQLMGSRTDVAHTELTFHYMRINQQPETLLGFLLRKFRYHDREEWLDHIQAGRLLVDRNMGDPAQLLKNGQIVRYLRPDYLEPAVDPSFEVIFEDEYLIAVNKSGNLPTAPSGKYFKNTLVHLLKSSGCQNLYALHRLDRETSGVILFARQKEIAQRMAALFREHRIEKTYTAILSRPLPSPHVFVSVPIAPDPNSIVRIKQGVVPEGKLSQTHFRELQWPSRQNAADEKIGQYAKVEALPLTGRTHQIRTHAAYLGCPIAGDKLYGLQNDGFLHWLQKGEAYLREQRFPLHRQLLHACRLRFKHPVTEKEMTLEASDHCLMVDYFSDSSLSPE